MAMGNMTRRKSKPSSFIGISSVRWNYHKNRKNRHSRISPTMPIFSQGNKSLSKTPFWRFFFYIQNRILCEGVPAPFSIQLALYYQVPNLMHYFHNLIFLFYLFHHNQQKISREIRKYNSKIDNCILYYQFSRQHAIYITIHHYSLGVIPCFS